MNSTEEDTYDKLRRVPYAEACVEYTMALIYYRSTLSTEERNAIANPVLKPLGWTVEDLFIESRKQEHDI